MKKKINVVTLGCSKNLVDSEHLMSHILNAGYDVITDSNDTDAKTVIINTCGFIKDAKEESIDTILQFVQAKESKQIDDVFVMGCLSQRYQKDLEKEIPNVSRYFGVNDIRQILNQLKIEHDPILDNDRLITTPSHFAYLKISEGCNRKCAFCAIPKIRGKHQSITHENLVAEASNLAKKGVKELILIAQDLSSYGIDLYAQHRLPLLLSQLNDVNGLEWIRLHYLYPDKFPLQILNSFSDTKLCKYIDMPIQHISNRILKDMRRGHTKDDLVRLLDSIRSKVPDMALRTTMLVGFPGETDAEFKELLQFVEEFKFDRLGVFTYSEEETTHAAIKYKDNVPEKIKQQRLDAIMELQQNISYDINQKKVGKTFKTIIDRSEDSYFVGRTEFDSPEVDNEVIINPMPEQELKVGQFYNIKITKAEDFDLYGYPVL